MSRRLLIDSLGWGVGLWVIGYVLGIVFFFFMPTTVVGWAVMPVGIAITLWVLLTRVQRGDLRRYAVLAVAWTVIAVAFDYFFLVLVFKPADGYYKLDVYIYYAVTFILPLAVGWWRGRRAPAQIQGA